jgi:arylformamidase
MPAADLFRTRDHVPDFDDKVKQYALLSDDVRRSLRAQLDIAYGPQPGQKLDIFLPDGEGNALPVHMFIHGGYWRMFSKDDFSYIARTVTAAGAIAVVIDYGLMPDIRLAEIVEQVRAAKSWITDNISRYGGNAKRLTVSGHSAGAHLATSLLTLGQHEPPLGVLLLGGVYDIGPLQQSFLQPLIGITDEEVREFSPVNYCYQSGIAVEILYGEKETNPFRAQALDLAQRLTEHGCHVRLRVLEARDHMSSMLDLGLEDTEAADVLKALIGRN